MHAIRRAPLATASALLLAALAPFAPAALAQETAAPAAASTAPEAPAPEPGEVKTIVSHGISAFGDLKYPADFAHFDYVNPDAPVGGEWTGRGTSASNTFDSLNPFILKGEAAQGLGLLFDSLLTGSGDEADSAYCLLCTTMEYPEDRSWVIFTLRDDIKFADGSPITPGDVVFSYEILRDKGAPGIKLSLRDVAGAEEVGPNKVKFTFNPGVSTRDLPSLVGGLEIMSRAWWKDRNFEESSLEPIMGSGPYEATDVKPGTSITYKRRADYWGWKHPAMVGSWNFEKITFQYYKDYTAAFEAFKGGGYLFHEEFFSKIWATGYDFPSLSKGWVVKDELPDERPSGTQGFWFNMRQPQLQDPRVRQAIAMAFDFEWSNEKLFYGLYDRTVSFFQNSPMMAEGMPSEAELKLLEPLKADLPETVFTEPAFVPPVTSGKGGFDRKLQREAMKLLNDAGWVVRDGVLRTNDKGETLKLEILDDSPTFERIIGPFVQNLRKLGVDASLRVVDPAQYQQRVEDFDYDAVPGRFVMSLTPGVGLRNQFASISVDQKGTPNLSGVNNKAVDALIEDMIKATSREELNVAGRALDRVLRAMQIWTPNWYKGKHTIAYWDVFGRPDIKPKYARGVMPFWWYDEGKAAKLKAAGAPL